MDTTSVKVEGPVMSLELNNDKNKVAAAGRKAFKIFSLEDGYFVEDVDLRKSDTVNLNYSFNDVVWSPKEEHMLATAATNGAIVTWNLNKVHHSKQDRVFSDHKRTVNRLCFHTFEPLLISGSQDGTIRCFDLRIREAGRIFKSNTESIRDVKFSPYSFNTFAAVSENGCVQLWDMRKQDRYYVQYTAHSEPIFSCDWHPECTWIATASRDKTIKIWDVSPSKPYLKYVVNTIASVGRVKWRPYHKYHVASVALVVDCNISVWDLRRPYIPFACFKGHKDIPTDIKWKNDPNVILSSGRDSQIFRHMFSDSVCPAESANPQSITISCRGDVMYTRRIDTEYTKLNKMQEIMIPKKFFGSEEFCHAASHLEMFKMKKSDITNSFIECACKYVLQGMPLPDICDRNAEIAKNLGKLNVEFVWKIIKKLFADSGHFGLEEESQQIMMEMNEDEDMVQDVRVLNESANNSDICLEGSEEYEDGTDNCDDDNYECIYEDGVVAGSESPPDEADRAQKATVAPMKIIPSRAQKEDDHHQEATVEAAHTSPAGDFLFGDKDMDPLSLDYDNCENLCLATNTFFVEKLDLDENDCTLPAEAFPLRHKMKDSLPTPPIDIFSTSATDFRANGATRSLQNFKFLNSEERQLLMPISMVKWRAKMPAWDCSDFVAQMLHYHANQGDFQTAITVLLALGDQRRHLTKNPALGEVVQEQWLLGYIDTLYRFKLWNVATEIINLSWISTVGQLNQHSTTMRTACGKCKRPMIRSGWLCDRCHSANISMCSICHEIVKGLYIWCQGCTHGGHVKHMKSWLNANKFCPTGCGHACEY